MRESGGFDGFCLNPGPPVLVAPPAAAPANAGQKRPVAEVIDLTPSSDDEAQPVEPPKAKAKAAGGCGGVAQPSNAAGKAAKQEKNEVIYTWQMGDCDGNGFHADMISAMEDLKKTRKCAGFEALGDEALDQMRTLPLNVGAVLMNKIRDEMRIPNLDVFVIKHANHLRNQWSVYDPETIFAEMQEEYDAEGATESDEGEDEFFDVPHSDSDSDDNAAQPGSPIVHALDSQGNSLEY